MSTEAKTENLPAVTTIKLNGEGRFMPQSLEDTFRLARMYVASGMLPLRFKTPESVVTAQQYAAELGIQGIIALRQIAVINGSPTLFGDLPLAVVRGTGNLEKIEEYLVTKDGTRISIKNKNIDQPFFAAVCILKRKGEEEREFIYSIDDAKVAGLWGKNVWLPHPKRMIQMRTRGWGLKDVFADALSGIAQGEYDFDTTIEKVVESEVVPPTDGSSKLNALASVKAAPEPQPEFTEPKQVQVVPAESAPKPRQGDFQSFNGSKVIQSVKPQPAPLSREILAEQIGEECKRLDLGMDGLNEKCVSDFKKTADELTAEEMQVILITLSKATKGNKAS